MNQNEGREKILETAFELISEVKDVNKVTIREIAKRAEVSIGLINYHFKTKDYMLMEAVSRELAKKATIWQQKSNDTDTNPKQNLKYMLIELMEIGVNYLYLVEIAAKFELTEGDINTPLFILPYIKQITKKDEITSKLIAFSLISSLQSATLRRNKIKKYLNIDIEKKEDRKKYVNIMVNSLL